MEESTQGEGKGGGGRMSRDDRGERLEGTLCMEEGPSGERREERGLGGRHSTILNNFRSCQCGLHTCQYVIFYI